MRDDKISDIEIYVMVDKTIRIRKNDNIRNIIREND